MSPSVPFDDETRRVIATLIRLLVSDQPGSQLGEVSNALQAFGRKMSDKDRNDAFVDLIENSYTEQEMIEALNARHVRSFKEGLAAGMKQMQAVRTAPPRVNGHASRHQEMALYCEQRPNRLTEWERKFIPSVLEQLEEHPLSARQVNKLEDIYTRLGGT
jgi:hypothetical protein